MGAQAWDRKTQPLNSNNKDNCLLSTFDILCCAFAPHKDHLRQHEGIKLRVAM